MLSEISTASLLNLKLETWCWPTSGKRFSIQLFTSARGATFSPVFYLFKINWTLKRNVIYNNYWYWGMVIRNVVNWLRGRFHTICFFLIPARVVYGNRNSK